MSNTNKHYVHRISEDKLITELKETIINECYGAVTDVKLVSQPFCTIQADLFDKNGNFIKRYILSDFDCERSFQRKTTSPEYIANQVDVHTIKRAWIHFLRDHYPEYREKFLDYNNRMAEMEIGK